MNTDNNTNSKQGNKPKIDIRDFFNGNIWTKEFIRRQYALIALIAVLFFVYINNGYRCEKQQAHIVKLKSELQDLRYEYLTLSAELVEKSRQSTISSKLNAEGSQLKESSTPAVLVK